MKRIAALAALAFTMLAVPATAAMASTGGGPGAGGAAYRQPTPIQIACPLPTHYRQGQVTVKAYSQAWLKVWAKRHHHGKPPFVTIACPFIPAKPLPRGCEPQRLVFDMAAGSSIMTEVSGPVLAPAQTFSYDGSSYTIISVNPGADSFTVFKDDVSLFTNPGDTITDGVALMCCSS
jgi:hypothetical protein